MQAYEGMRFDPPAPVALVTVVVAGSESVDVPMLLDTGADVSLLPSDRFQLFASTDARRYELVSFDGSRSTAPAVIAELNLLGKTFRGQFLLIVGWHGILGRNILNNLSLLFDGPSGRWAERR